jgi:hypothetical protein
MGWAKDLQIEVVTMDSIKVFEPLPSGLKKYQLSDKHAVAALVKV